MESESTSAPERPRRRRELLVFVLPNLFTAANFFCGFFSIIASIRGEWQNAAIAIIIGAFSDGLDGRIARLTKTQSRFGEEYDSMADLVTFGLSPAILMFQWALAPYGRIGWLATFMYATCAALRLARFNVMKQGNEKRYFQGCPSPLAAGTVATAVLFYLELGFDAAKDVYMLAIMFLLATAMISTVRYRSFKDLHFQSQQRFAYLFFAILILIILSSAPELLLFPIAVTYVLSGFVFEFTRKAKIKERLARLHERRKLRKMS